jgi:hypothetical protein
MPWGGYFAGDEITPIYEDGKKVMPGFRKCGRQDCCSPQHVIPFEN